MYYAATQQVNDARHIARTAQQHINHKTGMQVSRVLYPSDNTINTPERMLHIIAAALNENPDNYKLRTRVRNVVEMRFIAAMFLRSSFPTLTLQQIASLFGGQDHTSVMSGLARAYDLIYIGDEKFLKKYNTALSAINSWFRKEA